VISTNSALNDLFLKFVIVIFIFKRKMYTHANSLQERLIHFQKLDAVLKRTSLLCKIEGNSVFETDFFIRN